MLVLKRRVGEEIIITVGEETIVVKLVYMAGTNNIGIGVSASPDVRIDRKEIHDHIKETGFNPEAYPIKPAVPVAVVTLGAVRVWEQASNRRKI